MKYNKRSLRDIEVSEKICILRLDLNVPIQDGVITDNNRIQQCLPTIEYLLQKKARIIILSHFSRIKSLDDINSGKKSLRLVSEEIKNNLTSGAKLLFIPDLDFEKIRETINNNTDVNIFVLENTRYYDVNSKGEVVKWESKNSPELAKFWSSLGDVFINDAFGTSHRSHASNVGIAKNIKESVVGFLVEKELNYLSKAVDSTEKPKFLILGGSKVSDKLKLITSLIDKVEKMLIGGGMAYTFLKAQGKEVGNSIVEVEMIEECKSLMEKYKDKIILPVDHLVASEFKDMEPLIFDVEEKNWEEKIALDIGPKSASIYRRELEDAKIVIWNGPMGVFEFDNFSSGTRAIAEKLSDITKTGAYTVIGGGDSAAAAKKFNLSNDISFISTGGGASLSFFEGSAMPGIEIIANR